MSLPPTPGARDARARAAAREEREEAARAARHAASFGPCATCKVNVGPDGMHAWGCTAVPTARRANGGRVPT